MISNNKIKRIIELRNNDHTYKEIAQKLDVTKQYVHHKYKYYTRAGYRERFLNRQRKKGNNVNYEDYRKLFISKELVGW